MSPKNPKEGGNKNEGNKELPNEAEDFSGHAHWCHEALIQNRNLAEKQRIQYLGKIQVPGTSGRDFEVEALWIPEERPDFKDYTESSIQLFTIDKASRKLAALESFTFDKTEKDADSDFPEDVKIMKGSSDIITRFRNIGAGSATERGLEIVLQNLTEQLTAKSMKEENRKTVVIWEAVNGKIGVAEDAEISLAQIQRSMPEGKEKEEKIKELEELLAFHKAELERWFSIFGNEGKLGFQGNSYLTSKVIEPKGIPVNEVGPVDLQKYDLLIEKVRQTL